MNRIFVYLLMVSVSCLSFADLIAYEDFSYGNGAKVHAKRGGYGFPHGWVAKSGGCDDFAEQVSQFAVDGFDESVSFAKIRCGSITRTHYATTAPGVRQSYYYGFFFRIDDASSAAAPDDNPITLLELLAPDEQTTVASVQALRQRQFRVAIGGKEATFDYRYNQGQTYFLVARLSSVPKGYPDGIEVAVFNKWAAGMREPARWHISCQDEVESQIYKYAFGSFSAGKELSIGHLRVGTGWEDVLPGSNAKQLLDTETIVHKRLMYAPDVVRPINSGFSTVSILPSLSGKGMDVILTRGVDYLENSNRIYKPIGVNPQDVPEYSSPGLPLYDSGSPLKHLNKWGKFRAFTRPDGLYDVIDTINMEYLRNTGAGAFAEPVKITTRHSITGNRFIGDIDGDGVVDLLISHAQLEHSAQVWPGQHNPWWLFNEPDLGPSKDYENVGASRGRDIDGNWLGTPVTSRFYWAKGYWDNGVIAFEARKPIYLGIEDYQAQWRSWNSWGAWIGMLNLEGKSFVVAFGDIDSIVAMPVIKTGENVHLGKAQNLLKSGKRIGTTHLCRIVAITDIDDDGSAEIVLSAGSDGSVTVLKGKRVGEFENVGRICSTGGAVTANTLVTPCREDWDMDGFKDIIVGDASGHIWFMPGTKDATVYGRPIQFKADGKIIHKIPGEFKSLQGPQEAMWGYIQPTVGDWTGDGKPDILANDSSAELMLFKRTENIFELKQYPIKLNGAPIPAAWRVRPAIIPGEMKLAGDDRACLLYLDGDGELAVLVPKEKGSHIMQKSIKLTNTDGMTMRLCGPHDGLWGRTKFTVADWDGDGVWDIVFGAQGTISRHFTAEPSDYSSPYWMKNTGSSDKPVFADPKIIRTADGKKFKCGKHNFSVYPTDITGNGKLDLIAGEETGHIMLIYRDELKW